MIAAAAEQSAKRREVLLRAAASASKVEILFTEYQVRIGDLTGLNMVPRAAATREFCMNLRISNLILSLILALLSEISPTDHYSLYREVIDLCES